MRPLIIASRAQDLVIPLLSMPRLKLSAVLTGAQLAQVTQTERSIPIDQVICWSDSTTVLHWLRSESCCYKVSIRTWVAEIQNLTNMATWRYVDSAHNPVDHITRGLPLKTLMQPHQWRLGTDFLPKHLISGQSCPTPVQSLTKVNSRRPPLLELLSNYTPGKSSSMLLQGFFTGRLCPILIQCAKPQISSAPRECT